MNSEKEILRRMMNDYERAESGGAANGEHLREEDYIEIIESGDDRLADAIGGYSEKSDVSPKRAHLVSCGKCLNEFIDFYDFFARPRNSEQIAGKEEINAAWQAFVPRMSGRRQEAKRLAFFRESSIWKNYFGRPVWALMTLLVLASVVGFYLARQNSIDKMRLELEIAEQKQAFEERLKEIARRSSNDQSGEKDKERLTWEKTALEKRLAELENELERARKPPEKRAAAPSSTKSPRNLEPPDEAPLVAVNTPLFDVFPVDSNSRGGGADDLSSNLIVVPARAKSVVLILNAQGRADFPIYQAELFSNRGGVIWRGGGLRKDATGNFTLTLARTILKTGNYRLKLSGGNRPSLKTVAEYRLQVEVK